MRKAIGVRSIVLTFALFIAVTSSAVTQWETGGTVYWYVDASVNNLTWDPGTANVQQEIQGIMSSIADDWAHACGLNITVSQGTGNKRIKICAASLSGLPNQTIAITGPVPVGCEDGVPYDWEVVVTLNTSSQLIYKDAIDPVYMRDLSQESPPWTIDIRTVLLHELAHAFGMNGEGSVGVLAGIYHGSDREIDGEEAAQFRPIYSLCQSLSTRKWQRVRTSFDDGNPFHASTNGVLWSNMWSPRVTAGTMQSRASGWTVSWEEGGTPPPPIPTVQADLRQQIGAQTKKFKWWQFDTEQNNYATLYDLAVVLGLHEKTAKAWYYDAYPYALTQGEYCDGTTAACTYQVDWLGVATPYTSDVAPGFEASPYVDVEPVNSGDVFLYWRDNNGVRYYNSNMFVDVEQYSTLTPVFQRHLGTNHTVSDQVSESGTSTNNQRKIAYVDGTPGRHHQIYESCGQIFYCNSTDQGQSWSKERLLSDLQSTEVEKPSIFADTDSVWAVWNEDSEIRLVKFDPVYASVVMDYDVSSIQQPRAGCTPVLVRMNYLGSSVVLIVYEGYSLTVRWALFVDGVYQSQGDVQASIVNALQFSPSVVTYDANQFEIVWREDADVWYRPGRIVNQAGTLVLEWISPEEIVPFGNRPAVGAPTISHSSGTPGNIFAAVACETGASAPYGVSLTFRKWGSWWHVQTFIMANEEGRLWAPSISMLDEQARWTGFEHFRVAYNYTDNFLSGVPQTRQVWAMSPKFDKNGNLTDYPIKIQGAEALHPSVVTRPPLGGNLSIFTGLTSTASNAIENDYDGLNKTKSITWHRSRELSLHTDTTVVTFGLANVRIANGASESMIGWYHPVDSMVVGSDITVEDDFRTESFTVQQGTRLKYTIMDAKSGMNSMPPLMSLAFEVRTVGTNVLLGTLGTLIPNSVQNGKRVADINLNLSPYAGNTVYLRVSLGGKDSTVSLHAQDIWSANALSSANFPKGWNAYAEGSAMDFTAESVSLEQNYPNPFNPATTIEYSIPKKSAVLLTVHDGLGREVARLVDGEQAAGRHSIVFDATQLPSGLYYYRLAAGESTQVRRMTVVK